MRPLCSFVIEIKSEMTFIYDGGRSQMRRCGTGCLASPQP
jgi:hypothetical protein